MCTVHHTPLVNPRHSLESFSLLRVVVVVVLRVVVVVVLRVVVVVVIQLMDPTTAQQMFSPFGP